MRIEREIGRGGMGVVYLGWDRVLRRPVAVKFLMDVIADRESERFQRFIEGARAAASVRHPSLNVVYQADVVDGIPYLVMDYIRGPSLESILRERGPLNTGQAMAALLPASEAIGALHDRGIVHRDIKPANIMIDQDGGVFVTDFGLALDPSFSRSSRAAGTPAYMAPEMFDGEISPRSDVYAMGITTFALLDASVPFTGSLDSIRREHRQAGLPIERLTDRKIDTGLCEVLQRATHKNPMFRHKTATHFCRALRKWVAERDVAITETSRLIPGQGGAGEKDVSQTLGDSDDSSYVERIATLAEHKQNRKKRERSHSRETDQDEAAPELRPGGIRYDLFCVECQYNLRGLQEGADCPECGTRLEASTRPDRLIFADKEWIRRWVGGHRRLTRSCMIYFWFLITINLFGIILNVHWTISAIPVQMGLLIMTCFVMEGAFRATTPAPTTLRSGGSELKRWILKFAVVGSCLIGAWAIITKNARGSGASACIWLGSLSASAVIYGSYIIPFIERIPDAQLAGQLRRRVRSCSLLFVLLSGVLLCAQMGLLVGRRAFVLQDMNLCASVAFAGVFLVMVLTLNRLRRPLARALVDHVDRDSLFG